MSYAPQLLLACTALVLSFAACNKDDDDVEEKEPVCRVSKITYYDSGAEADSALYTYTGDNVTKVQLSNENYTLEYNGNIIVKKNHFRSGGSTADFYSQISYNTDGSISKVEYFAKPNTGTTYVLVFRTEYTYSGGKISKLVNYDIENNTATKVDEYNYTFTGNNISTAVLTDYTEPTPTSQTINYSYDTNPNYFTKQNKQTNLVDPLFYFYFIEEIEGIFVPIAFNANNITGISGAGTLPFSYTTDTNQNLTEVKFNNQLFARYTYQCQ